MIAFRNWADRSVRAPGEWGMRAPVLEPLSELALAESNGKLYLMGGYPQNRVTARTVQIYDTATDTWAYGPQLPLPNNHGMAASVNGKIYLIGGQLNADDPPGTNSYVNTVYELDPAIGVWVTRAPMPTARSGIAAAVVGNRIYVFGGEEPDKTFDNTEAYEPEKDRWLKLAPMPTARHGLGAAGRKGRFPSSTPSTIGLPSSASSNQAWTSHRSRRKRARNS